MGWTERKGSGNVGTTGEIEDAHRALDEAGVDPGPLAMRAWKAALIIKRHKNEGNQKFFTVDI